MDLQEMFMEFFPAITIIFKMGFIPTPEEIYEITKEQYAAYKKQGGDISEQLYTIIPKNYKYLASAPTNEVSLLTKDDVHKLGKAAVYLYLYAEKGGCKSEKSDDVLAFAAERLPSSFTKGTKFERPLLKELKPDETPLTEKEEWVDFLASVMGEGATLNIKVTNQDTKETENITLPIEKQR